MRDENLRQMLKDPFPTRKWTREHSTGSLKNTTQQ